MNLLEGLGSSEVAWRATSPDPKPSLHWFLNFIWLFVFFWNSYLFLFWLFLFFLSVLSLLCFYYYCFDYLCFCSLFFCFVFVVWAVSLVLLAAREQKHGFAYMSHVSWCSVGSRFFSIVFSCFCVVLSTAISAPPLPTPQNLLKFGLFYGFPGKYKRKAPKPWNLVNPLFLRKMHRKWI